MRQHFEARDVILTAEIMSYALLKALFEGLPDLFPKHPERIERVEQLLRELLIDEIIHVRFAQYHIPRWAPHLSRWTRGLVIWAFTSSLPSFGRTWTDRYLRPVTTTTLSI